MADLYRDRLKDIIEYTSVENKPNRIAFKAKANKKNNSNSNNNSNNNNDNNEDNQDDEESKKEQSLADELMNLVTEGIGNYEEIGKNGI